MTTPELQPRQQILSGIAWTSGSQIAQALLSAAAMLVLVRIIPPADYGRAAVVVSFLALLNAFAFDHFAAQALQLPEGSDPDWNTHWSFGFYLQSALFLIANIAAVAMRFIDSYATVGPLLHVASVGVLLNWPCQIRLAMLRRALDFRRLRLLQVAATFLSIVASLALGLLGKGAYAIVLANAIVGVPFVIDLAAGKWRPAAGWWRWRDWSDYRHQAAFGSKVALTSLLYSSRAALEAAVLPATVGFAGIGLMGRALALYRLTIGRVATAVNETVYPVLPQSVGDIEVYRRRAGAFIQTVFVLAIPGAVFIGVEGPALSRIVYGTKWIAADPMFLPAALLGAGLAIFTAGSNILLARSRMREVVTLSVVFAAASLPAIALPLLGRDLVDYLWMLAACQAGSCAIAFWIGRSSLPAGWISAHFVPVAAGSLAGAAALAVLDRAGLSLPLSIRLLAGFIVYSLVVVIVIQTIRPRFMSATFAGIPRLAAFARNLERLSLRRTAG